MIDEITYVGSTDGNHTQYGIIYPPKPKSKWSFVSDFSIAFPCPAPMPNWFHRTMQRLILGVYWKKADE